MTCSLTKVDEEEISEAEIKIKEIIDASENEAEAIKNINQSGEGTYDGLDYNARTNSFSFFVKITLPADRSRRIKIMKRYDWIEKMQRD